MNPAILEWADLIMSTPIDDILAKLLAEEDEPAFYGVAGTSMLAGVVRASLPP